MKPPTDAWDRLADLIEYPADGGVVDGVAACLESPAPFDAVPPLERFRNAMATAGLASMQERYVEVFDWDPACTLDVTWHLLGDRPERGTYLAGLREDLARAGVDEAGELPDHLPVLLRLIAREDRAAASALAAFIAPAVARVYERLSACGNPYADVMDAVARMLTVLQRQEEQP
jgi:nitrate reductase molybdenum cofactor assembly chaperone NarJ/NarW